MAYLTSPISMGGGLDLPQVNLPQPTAPMGMFGGGGKFGLKQALAFGLAGLVARRNPALLQGLMGAMMQRQREEAEAQRAANERDAQFQNALDLYNYKRDNPLPPNNDTVNDYTFIASKLGPEAADTFLRTKTNPIVMTPMGPMPYSAVSGGGLPTAPVGKLTPINGGPTPPASGAFPAY